MIEFLLAELTRRPPSDRTDYREGMALCTAWSLGVILLGYGTMKINSNARENENGSQNKQTKTSQTESWQGLTDICIEDRLQLLIDGGLRPPESLWFPVSLY